MGKGDIPKAVLFLRVDLPEGQRIAEEGLGSERKDREQVPCLLYSTVQATTGGARRADVVPYSRWAPFRSWMGQSEWSFGGSGGENARALAARSRFCYRKLIRSTKARRLCSSGRGDPGQSWAVRNRPVAKGIASI